MNSRSDEEEELRASAIDAFYQSGASLREVGKAFGISGERVRQILVANGRRPRTRSEAGELNRQRAALEKQAKLFGDQLSAVLARYRNRQLTSAEVVKALVDLAKEIREARHRHEQLGLSEEEAAFYDALAESPDEVEADPELAKIARDLVESIKGDLAVDWTNRESREASIRIKIKRLLRRSGYQPPATNVSGGGGKPALDQVTDLILDQARVMYRNWPEPVTRTTM